MCVLAGLCSWEGVVHPSICPSGCLCWYEQSVQSFPTTSHLHIKKINICLAVSLFSLYPSLHPFLFLCLHHSLFLSQPSVSDRAPQRAVITQKRRRWKVGKVLVQLSPTLHACFCSLTVNIFISITLRRNVTIYFMLYFFSYYLR